MKYNKALIVVQSVSCINRIDLPNRSSDWTSQEVAVLWSEGQGREALTHTSQIIGAETRHGVDGDMWIADNAEIYLSAGALTEGVRHLHWGEPEYMVVYYRV